MRPELAPLVRPVLDLALGAAAVVDDDSSLVFADVSGSPVEHLVELMENLLPGSLLMVGVGSLDNGSEEDAGMFIVHAFVVAEISVTALEDVPPRRPRDVLPATVVELRRTLDLRGMKLEITGV